MSPEARVHVSPLLCQLEHRLRLVNDDDRLANVKQRSLTLDGGPKHQEFSERNHPDSRCAR